MNTHNQTSTYQPQSFLSHYLNLYLFTPLTFHWFVQLLLLSISFSSGLLLWDIRKGHQLISLTATSSEVRKKNLDTWFLRHRLACVYVCYWRVSSWRSRQRKRLRYTGSSLYILSIRETSIQKTSKNSSAHSSGKTRPCKSVLKYLFRF